MDAQQVEELDARGVVVVGGGPAGLQAALTAARMGRRVVVLDSGAYRNRTVRHMHNVVTHDGRDPADFRAAARADLAAYPSVEVRRAWVERVTPVDGRFEVAYAPLADEDGDHGAGAGRSGRLVASRVLLATGLRDELPDVPGLAELWGTVAAACPYCHGYETAGRPTALLGADPMRLGHLAGLLGPVGSRLVALTDGVDLASADPVAAADLAARGVPVRAERVLRLEPAVVEGVGGARAVLEGGDVVEVAAVFVTSGRFVQAAPFAAQLGLALHPSGCVAVDAFGRTSVPGVRAAGDLAHTDALPGPMAAVLVAAAAGQLAAAGLDMDDLAAAHGGASA